MTASAHKRVKFCLITALGFLVTFLVAMPQASAETMQELTQHTHIHGISYNRGSGEAELLLATHHGIFAVLRDGTAVQISNTHDFMGFSADPGDPLRYFGSGHPAGGGNSGFLESRDNGATWSRLSDGVNGPVDFHNLAVSVANPKTIFGVFDGIQKSSDGGTTWQISGTAPNDLVQLVASSESSERIFAATKSGLKVSNDSGQSWSIASFDGEIVSAVQVERNGTVYAFVLGHGFLKSKEASLSEWSPLSNSFGKEIPLHMATKPDNPTQIVVSTQTSEVFESRDGGNTWRLFGQP